MKFRIDESIRHLSKRWNFYRCGRSLGRLSRVEPFTIALIAISAVLAASPTAVADESCPTRGQSDSPAAPAGGRGNEKVNQELAALSLAVSNRDFTWDANPFALEAVISDRAEKLKGDRSWIVRRNLLAGLRDPNRYKICHVLLSYAYESEGHASIGKRMTALLGGKTTAYTWNGLYLFENRDRERLSAEAEREVLRAAWQKRIGEWEREQFLKDPDGPSIQKIIHAFQHDIDRSPLEREHLERAREVEAILAKRDDLAVHASDAYFPGLAESKGTEAYRVLKAAFIAGNMRAQLCRGHGRDCPLAGVRTMLPVYHSLELLHTLEKSDALDEWDSWSRTNPENLTQAVMKIRKMQSIIDE